jgi:hypothetical protein
MKVQSRGFCIVVFNLYPQMYDPKIHTSIPVFLTQSKVCVCVCVTCLAVCYKFQSTPTKITAGKSPIPTEVNRASPQYHKFGHESFLRLPFQSSTYYHSYDPTPHNPHY